MARYILIASMLAALLPQPAMAERKPKPPAASPAAPSPEVQAQMAMLDEGRALLASGDAAGSIAKFDRIIAWYEARYRDEKRQIYCASGLGETMEYMLRAAGQHKDAIAIEPVWAEALFHKGFALIDLGQRDEARTYLDRALEKSPSNSQYLSERAEWEKNGHNWQAAHDLFEQAAAVADFVPEDRRQFWLSRAWRGVGFTLIELGRLDEAEAMFRKCLAADPNDGKARSELNYIAGQRAAARGAGKT